MAVCERIVRFTKRTIPCRFCRSTEAHIIINFLKLNSLDLKPPNIVQSQTRLPACGPRRFPRLFASAAECPSLPRTPFDAQLHIGRQPVVTVDKVGQRLPRHAQYCGAYGDVQIVTLDNLAHKIADMGGAVEFDFIKFHSFGLRRFSSCCPYLVFRQAHGSLRVFAALREPLRTLRQRMA